MNNLGSIDYEIIIMILSSIEIVDVVKLRSINNKWRRTIDEYLDNNLDDQQRLNIFNRIHYKFTSDESIYKMYRTVFRKTMPDSDIIKSIETAIRDVKAIVTVLNYTMIYESVLTGLLIDSRVRAFKWLAQFNNQIIHPRIPSITLEKCIFSEDIEGIEFLLSEWHFTSIRIGISSEKRKMLINRLRSVCKFEIANRLVKLFNTQH